MANHDWNAMPHQAHAIAAGASLTSSGAATAAILVETGGAWQAGGCGSAGAFGGGALLALPLLVAAMVLRRLAKRAPR
jgi:uncharacterized protein (TIGR03382 family)